MTDQEAVSKIVCKIDQSIDKKLTSLENRYAKVDKKVFGDYVKQLHYAAQMSTEMSLYFMELYKQYAIDNPQLLDIEIDGKHSIV